MLDEAHAGTGRPTRLAVIVLALLLLACASVFGLLAHDAGLLGRDGGPAPAKVTPPPADTAPGVRLVSYP
ncbi:hypothetical protein [Actinomadura rayongensis]|uniref:Uncharacterized protein n=1 Tax=Actinomadura rayongensis TaxID=1429076 RepID=A0A6I4W226_9ACTN|nr:hypothetical protein [Actinomadura rayongensis]MXQ63481.1 hypothetical protein [Actinomadura rayongensis]